MRSDWLIIGIAGATCSGKTTLATKLHEHLEDSVLINQDEYFFPIDDPRHELIPELNHFNWELLSSMDMPRMIEDVERLITSPSHNEKVSQDRSKLKILIMDGFLLFNCKPLADMCDVRFFLEMTRDQCWERRKNRIYDPPDVANYFEKIVWPEYVRNKMEILRDEDLSGKILFIDGSQTAEQIFRRVHEETKLRLKT